MQQKWLICLYHAWGIAGTSFACVQACDCVRSSLLWNVYAAWLDCYIQYRSTVVDSHRGQCLLSATKFRPAVLQRVRQQEHEADSPLPSLNVWRLLLRITESCNYSFFKTRLPVRRALTEAFPPVMLLQVHCFKFGPVSCPKRIVFSSSAVDYKPQFHFRFIFAAMHYVRTLYL